MEDQKKKKFFSKIKSKYRLVILNDASFEEKFSFRLSPLNLLLLAFSAAIVLIVFVSVIIIYTPLRESIPGYTDVSLREDLTRMVLKTDSLEKELQQNNQYLSNLSAILNGEEPAALANDSSITPVSGEVNPSIKSKEDSMLREYVEREEAYSLEAESSGEGSNNTQLFYFPPLLGSLTNLFNPSEEHFGVDIVAPKDEAIKATLPGTVIFAEWTVETGYVIQLQHANNTNSIYKHNSVLLKKQGDVVHAGEAIAIVGNSGKLTSGPHLHFELWQDGEPIDPTKFINFE